MRCRPRNTEVASRSRVTRISSSPRGASASTSARVRPSSAPASRISTPGPMTSAMSGTTSGRGDCPIVTSPTTGRRVVVVMVPC